MKKAVFLLILCGFCVSTFSQHCVATVKIDSTEQTSCHSCLLYANVDNMKKTIIYVANDTMDFRIDKIYKMKLEYYPVIHEYLSVRYDSCYTYYGRDNEYIPFNFISLEKKTE